jgi:hypothetical protein
MRELWLEHKVFIINLLIFLKLRKNVWHRSHLELGKIRGDRYTKFFNPSSFGD